MADTILTAPTFFADDMILQQKATIRVYGRARPNANVTLTLERFAPVDVGIAPTTGDIGLVFTETNLSESDCYYDFKLPPQTASYDVYRLTIESEGEKLCYNNVLFGEVWFAAGQESMALAMAKTPANAKLEQYIDSDYLRIFTMSEDGLEKGQRDYSYFPLGKANGGAWIKCGNPVVLPAIPALPYHFGRLLRQDLGIPVGIFAVATPSTYLHTWLSREIVEDDAIIKNHVRELKHYRDQDNWNSVTAEKKKASADSTSEPLRPFVQMRRSDFMQASRLRLSAQLPEVMALSGFEKKNQPSALYNHKIAPFTGLGIRGILWSHGERDIDEPEYYARSFPQLVEIWQRMFVSPPGGLSLLLSLIQPSVPKGPDHKRLALFNETLAALRHQVSIRSGIATVNDLSLAFECGEVTPTQHYIPNHKLKLAERLHLLSLGLAYHYDVPITAPECAMVEHIGGKIMLSFDHVGSGLRVSGDGKLKGFSICGPNRIFVEAEARALYGVRVLVWHDEVKEPVSCAYAFTSYNQDANLTSGEGVPVVPFRIDQEASTWLSSHTWMHCDTLTSFVFPKADIKDYQMLESDEHPGVKKIWQINSGRADLQLDASNKRSGGASLLLSYKNADERSVRFGPLLSYASFYPPLNLSHWSFLKLDVFNPDHQQKTMSLYLHDVNGRQVTLENQAIDVILDWQTLIFDLSKATVDLMRIDKVEFVVEDAGAKGTLTIDRVYMAGLKGDI